MSRSYVARAAESAAVPIVTAQAALATAEHASEWTRGTINPPSALVETVQDNTPDVMLGALAGTSASLAIEAVTKFIGWLSAPRKAEVRAKRTEAMQNSTACRGIKVLLGAAAGTGSGYGRGAAAMVSGGFGGTGSGLLVARRSNRRR